MHRFFSCLTASAIFLSGCASTDIQQKIDTLSYGNPPTEQDSKKAVAEFWTTRPGDGEEISIDEIFKCYEPGDSLNNTNPKEDGGYWCVKYSYRGKGLLKKKEKAWTAYKNGKFINLLSNDEIEYVRRSDNVWSWFPKWKLLD